MCTDNTTKKGCDFMLDARNQRAFDSLERAYLYDFPEPSEEVMVTCEECGESVPEDEIIRMDSGVKCCRRCLEDMLNNHEITREEFEYYEV